MNPTMWADAFRQLWKDFWEHADRKHVHVPESSLIADKESTAMFNLAGMQQLIPYLSGKPHPLGTRLYNIQKCVRTNDLDEVGDNTHLTMFEMMGNRSLGDYFKKESVEWSRDFLVNRVKLDPRKIAVTVFEGDENAARDEETAGYRKGVGMQNISYLAADDNRWSPGPVGPCGPDTEIFYRVGASEFPPEGSTVGNDSDNRMEIRNNVFMEFYRDETGTLSKLANQNVDTGMGFERMCRLLQGKESPYETDIFWPVIESGVALTGAAYDGHKKSRRIVADHLRTATMMIEQGVSSSNEGRGYVLRRIVRRAYYNLRQIDGDWSKHEQIISFAVAYYFARFGITSDVKKVVTALLAECQSFSKTIAHGQKVFDGIIAQAKGQVTGADMFLLYDTHGFPVELTEELALHAGVKVDKAGFDLLMEQAKQKSRSGAGAMFSQDVDRAKYLTGITPTTFVGYKDLSTQEAQVIKDFTVDGQRVIILDRTPFYAEGGGQKGDRGIIVTDAWEELQVIDTKSYEGVWLHFVGQAG